MAKVDFLRYKFFNDCSQNIGFDHCINLVSEQKLLQNLLPCNYAQRICLIGNACGIQTANYGHRQNHIKILATHIYIALTIIGNSPYKINVLLRI